MTENSNPAEITPATTPAADSRPIAESTPLDERTAGAGRGPLTRTLLIAGGSVLAAAVLVGGGVAVGAAIADDGDDDDAAEVPSSVSADRGTHSTAELAEIVAAAGAAADGEAVGVEADTDGSWNVEFETNAGDETEVRVGSDGSAEVVSTDAADPDDTAPQHVLDADTLDALVSAAMAEVDGRIVDIEIDADAASPFDVSVVQSNGRMLDLQLDAALKVISITPA